MELARRVDIICCDVSAKPAPELSALCNSGDGPTAPAGLGRRHLNHPIVSFPVDPEYTAPINYFGLTRSIAPVRTSSSSYKRSIKKTVGKVRRRSV